MWHVSSHSGVATCYLLTYLLQTEGTVCRLMRGFVRGVNGAIAFSEFHLLHNGAVKPLSADTAESQQNSGKTLLPFKNGRYVSV